MNFYQSLGYLVLGSRLRRISESFLSEITRAYQQEGIAFDARWFPVFYLLSRNETLSIRELSEQMEVSHPAASQLITHLKSKGLVKTKTSGEDGRKQLVTFTKDGKLLLNRILPVWDSILVSMEDLANSQPDCAFLLPAITALETAFQSVKLADKIGENLASGARSVQKGADNHLLKRVNKKRHRINQ